MAEKPIETVCIVGAGFMGREIGFMCAQGGYLTYQVDRSPAALEQAAQFHQAAVAEALAVGQLSAAASTALLSRLRYTTSLQEGAATADIAIEAVPEVLAVKRAVFAELDRVCPPHAILAANSSSFCVSEIEDATRRPAQVLNMHFFSGLRKRPGVELMSGSATAAETLARAEAFARSIRVLPLKVRKESKGFIINRVWRVIKKECLHVADDGIASPEDIDRAFMLVFGTSVGPFGLMDEFGLDVVRDVELSYFRQSGDERDAPPRILLEKTERGDLGRKTGRGFYTYPHPAYEDPNWLKVEDE